MKKLLILTCTICLLLTSILVYAEAPEPSDGFCLWQCSAPTHCSTLGSHERLINGWMYCCSQYGVWTGRKCWFVPSPN